MKTIQFLGATRTVTGSKHAVRTDDSTILIDCGLFQGLKELRLKNWNPLPIDLVQLDAVLLTHAHVDHSGYLPRLVKDGYKGPVYASSGTCALCRILLPDTGKLEEEDARYANRRGFSKHAPALPLFTEAEAKAALRNFQPIPVGEPFQVTRNAQVRLGLSGHILGSAFILVELTEHGRHPVNVLFSGDLGRSNRPILNDPQSPFAADYLVLESTYGDRLHSGRNAGEHLTEIITETVLRGGSVVIPSFAVGRTQELLYIITELRDRKKIPDVPIFVDSPMAVSATQEYLRHAEEHDAEMRERMSRASDRIIARVSYIKNFSESQALASSHRPSIVISSSGMATGGRVLHHLAARLPEAKNTVVLVGYQAAGTRGRLLLDGAEEIKIHGEVVPVKAQVSFVDELSAHADYSEIMSWLREFPKVPRKTFIVHGEEGAAEALASRIESELGWKTLIPEYGQEVEL